MAGFNHVVMVGRVGKYPHLKQTNEGVSYCRFRLAVDQGKEEPLWLSVVAWLNLATQVEKYVKKGSLVLVSGRLSIATYTDKENRKQTGVEIVALDVRFLDQKPKEDMQAQTKQPSPDRATDGQAALAREVVGDLERSRGGKAHTLSLLLAWVAAFFNDNRG